MQILQAKVRCIKGVTDSGWFKPGRKVTILAGQESDTRSQILRGLEALNPLYDVTLADTLGDHPETWLQGKHQRRVIQQKKTAIFTVFSSLPELVKTLALIDESLIETDRIELGRRLDYSRWISFVELPASARWSDISEAMHNLRSQAVNNADFHDSNETFFNTCKQTDRLKDELARKCHDWLLTNKSLWTGDSAALCQKCLEKVNLHERFKLANTLVEEYLPPMILLHPETLLKDNYSFAEMISESNSQEPVAALLQKICSRFGISSKSEGDIELLKDRISHVLSDCPQSAFPVSFTIHESGFALEGLDRWKNNRLAMRVNLIWFVNLLTLLLWQRFPIFLLDRFDKHLSDEERSELSGSLARLGEHTQILVSPASMDNQGDYESAAILHLHPDGRIE